MPPGAFAQSCLVPRMLLGTGFDCFPPLFPRSRLLCQRKLMEVGGGWPWSWAGHPVTQVEVIFIDIHGADSKLSP